MCELYLGPTGSYSGTPPTPFWTNASIEVGTGSFNRGTAYPIPVTLQNHQVGAMNGCMSSVVKLYWADPVTSFTCVASQEIPITTGQPAVQPISGASSFGDSSVVFNFTFSPDASVFGTGTDPGHVCLLGAGFCASTDCSATAPEPVTPGNNPDVTNNRIAIHNIHVQDPMPGMIRHWPFRTWPFFFGAAHGADVAGRTRLVARAYDPRDEGDRVRILELVAMRGVRAALGPGAKFAVPAEVHLGLGLENILLTPAKAFAGPAPRLGYTGTVRPELADDLIRGAWTKATAGHAPAESVLEMVPHQIRQAGIHVVPHGPDRDHTHAYAVEVRHELITKAGPVVMGGLTVIFVAPSRPW